MRYGFVARHQSSWPVTTMCWMLQVSHGGFYGWRGRGPSKRSVENARLSGLIRTSFLDEANRGGLGIEVATGIPAARVIRFLSQLIEIHGRPEAIRCDNGPELTSGVFTEWCKAQDIELRFIQPGKHDHNAFIERFNRSYREENLNGCLFNSVVEV